MSKQIDDDGTEYKNITISDEGREIALQLYTTLFNLCNHTMCTVNDLFFDDEIEEINDSNFGILSQLIADLTMEPLNDDTNIVPFKK